MRSFPYLSARIVTTSLVALASLSMAALAAAQNQYPIYSENFNTGYTAGNTLSDQNGWTTNDEYTGGKYTYNTTQNGDIGQSDFVGYLSNVSTTPTNYAAFLGGAFGQAVAPGVGANTSVTVNHSLPTAGQSNVVFSTDYQVTSPVDSFGNVSSHDNFAFALTGATGTLLSINFVNPSVSNNASDNITYTNQAGVSSATAYGMGLGSGYRYRLTINVNVTAGTFSAAYQAETTSGVLLGAAPTTLASNVTYGTGDITGYAATWTLADKTSLALANNLAGAPSPAGTNNVAHTDAGLNALYFDNVLVTVPEPSTYALLALGALGMIVTVRRARRTQLA